MLFGWFIAFLVKLLSITLPRINQFSDPGMLLKAIPKIVAKSIKSIVKIAKFLLIFMAYCGQ